MELLTSPSPLRTAGPAPRIGGTAPERIAPTGADGFGAGRALYQPGMTAAVRERAEAFVRRVANGGGWRLAPENAMIS